jgi:hypothetical protein
MRTGSDALELSDAAGHAFRRRLPPHVLLPIASGAVQSGWRLTLTDCREFLMAYCAMFLAVSAFIS